MQYSYNWLKELTKTEKPSKELAETVMLKGFELEEMKELKMSFEKIIVGEIIKIKKHLNADKLQVTQVNIGDEKLQIVCGAHNIKIGDKVPVALIGAVIPLNKIEIKKTNIREVESCGMLCAEDELGLGKDHSGIMILDSQAKIGQTLVDHLNLDDVILDFDILPNRAHDCLSYRGMANEICAMEENQFRVESGKLKVNKEKSGLLKVEIRDKELCPRYIGAVMSGVKIKPSPKWMQVRLVASGMEPINNVVDITNYVMLEIGSPLHAFDFKNISESLDKKAHIIIRKSQENEKLELLDGTNLKLTKDDLVIASDQGAIALAGIKGGKKTGINKGTSQIILEAANFNSFNIRRTRQRHCLLTEAQARFEKGISSVLSEKATQRAIELFEKYADAKLEEVVDADFSDEKKQFVDFDFSQLEKMLGMKVEKKQALKNLKNLGFDFEESEKESFKVEIPYWRLDIEGQEDLFEEIGRIIGYEKIENKSIRKDIQAVEKNEMRNFEWELRSLFAGKGFDEVMNYSFYSEQEAEFCGTKNSHFKIKNPLNQGQTLMRKTLLLGVAKNVALNEKNFDNFSIFEIGRIYEIGENNIPNEKLKIAGASLDKNIKSEKGFFELKGKLESVLKFLSGEMISFSRSKDGFYENIFHKTRSADIFINNELVGVIGEINFESSKLYGVKNKAIAFEMDLKKIKKLIIKKKEFIAISKFPTVDRDISMFVERKTEVAMVEKIIKNSSDNLLSLELFDIFEKDGSDKKSLAFHMKFGSNEKTLKNKEVDLDMANIIKNLEKEAIDVRKE